MIFHGVNVVVKLDPYLPTTDKFSISDSLNDDDIAYCKKWGFNFVRLGVMWEGYETAPGKWDESYLDKISAIVNNLGKHGIYTLIDLHQDMMSRITCGEGVPTWYLDTHDFPTKCSDLPFGLLFYYAGVCKPFEHWIPDYDVNKITPLDKCLKNDFENYFFTPETMYEFEKLYTKGHPLNSGFLKYWDGVSKHFKDNQYVIGYDLINEPLPGSALKNPLLYFYADRQLQALYQQASEVVRKNDKNKIVFYSASQVDLAPVLGGIIFNTSFTESPSKGVYAEKETMVDHVYCQLIVGQDWGQDDVSREKLGKTCKSFIDRRVAKRAKNSKDLGNGLIYNEFGACQDTETCALEIQ